MKLFFLLIATVIIHSQNVQLVPVGSDNVEKINEEKSLEISDEKTFDKIQIVDDSTDNEELLKREKKSPDFRRFGRYATEEMNPVGAPHHKKFRPPVYPSPSYPVNQYQPHHSYAPPPAVYHQKPVHFKHGPPPPQHYRTPAQYYRQEGKNEAIVGLAQPNYNQQAYKPQPTYSRPLSYHHHHQPQSYAAPQASCGSNLMIGCQPQVQHVPCSSSYAHSAPAYHTHAPHTHVSHAPASYPSPSPAPTYQAPASTYPAAAPTYQAPTPAYQAPIQTYQAAAPVSPYTPQSTPYRTAELKSTKDLGSPLPSNLENKPQTSNADKTSSNTLETSDKKSSSKTSKNDDKSKVSKEKVGSPNQAPPETQETQQQPEKLQNDTSEQKNVDKMQKFKEIAQQKLREAQQATNPESPLRESNQQQSPKPQQMEPASSFRQSSEGQPPFPMSDLQLLPNQPPMGEPSPPQAFQSSPAQTNPSPMMPTQQSQIVGSPTTNMGMNTAGGTPIQNAYYSRNTVW